MIKTADYLIDLGPEGGDGGGQVVAVGTPEEVAQCAASHTGRYLRRALGLDARREAEASLVGSLGPLTVVQAAPDCRGG